MHPIDYSLAMGSATAVPSAQGREELTMHAPFTL